MVRISAMNEFWFLILLFLGSCGRAYPCDVCHDEKSEDGHEAEWAHRMIWSATHTYIHIYIHISIHIHTHIHTHVFTIIFHSILFSGFCSREQSVQNECQSCGSTLGRRARHFHWEGGAGMCHVCVCTRMRHEFACFCFVYLISVKKGVEIKCEWIEMTGNVGILCYCNYYCHMFWKFRVQHSHLICAFAGKSTEEKTKLSRKAKNLKVKGQANHENKDTKKSTLRVKSE